ncbi:membrane protein involved in the export of O-antigen and teichoic acid [Candidatus Methanoperedens nitroreducens]|uniref:Membrane protein involved in the export of O-antigen and teichoic acid n=1 Tax=Candidatus Methanoperedens nitratireducens TaxID=1392998 RepID=A0A062UUA8_9EURY|nr:flippase [Candidatus Methanoperedens nitroreducens]KCZ70616.1 membrane protein involved in the export of O-antigen and teichoic acid [Candidatus Methanoperedens nitroreducens]MDJ1420472.1 flippase [Candidatus Methanoperedens sp.]
MASMGQGAVYLMISNIIFLGSGYAIHVGLGRLLGPEDYGIFGVTIAIITFVGLLLRSGITQAASKFIAEDTEKSKIIAQKTAKLQFVFGITVFLIYFFSSELIADMFGDKELIPYIKLSSFAILTYAVFALYLNIVNGLKHYGDQARMLSIYSLAKLGGVFLLVALGFGIYGAVIGFILAPVAGAIAGIKYLKIDFIKNIGDFDIKKLIYFAAPLTVFAVSYNLIGSIDLFLVKSILSENIYTGYYTASGTIARVPAFLFLGLSMALFPAVSKAVIKKDQTLTTSYIQDSLRYMLMLIIPVSFLINATADDLVSFLYSAKYAPAAEPLKILIFGWALLALFQLLATILSAGGYPRLPAYIVCLSLLISFLFNSILIPVYGLPGAALATTVTGLFAVSLAALYVHKIYRASVGLSSILKIFGASVVVNFLAGNIKIHHYFLPIEYIILFGIYILFLFFLREINNKDFQTFKNLIKKEVTV